MAEITLIDNRSGCVSKILTGSNMAVAQFFAEKVEGDPRHVLVRVNRKPVGSSCVLQDGDRVSVTPLLVNGSGPDGHYLYFGKTRINPDGSPFREGIDSGRYGKRTPDGWKSEETYENLQETLDLQEGE